MKIVGLSGNPYSNATNLKVLEKISNELKLSGHEFEIIHAIKDFPLFNPQKEYQEKYDIVNYTCDNIKSALEWMLSESTIIQKPVVYIVSSKKVLKKKVQHKAKSLAKRQKRSLLMTAATLTF